MDLQNLETDLPFLLVPPPTFHAQGASALEPTSFEVLDFCCPFLFFALM